MGTNDDTAIGSERACSSDSTCGAPEELRKCTQQEFSTIDYNESGGRAALTAGGREAVPAAADGR